MLSIVLSSFILVNSSTFPEIFGNRLITVDSMDFPANTQKNFS